jgi:hypothetical protein
VQADHHDRHDARGGGQEREQDLVQKAGEVPAVGGVGEEPDIDAEPPRFERSADASMRLGRRRSMGSIAASSSIAVLLRVSGVNWSASWSGETAGFGDHVEAGGQLGERALHGGQRPEDRGDFRGHGQPVVARVRGEGPVSSCSCRV